MGLLSFLAVCLSSTAALCALPPAQPSAFDRAVEAEMKRQGLVGLGVGIVRDGKVVLARGYGFANREKRVPFTTRTICNWASNSKPIVALAAMQLVEQNKLDLDADIRKYLPSLPKKSGVVTTRLLLCHQSGIPHYTNGKIIRTPRTFKEKLPYLDPEKALHRFDRSPLIFPPGSKLSYSSYAYVVLSAVVQRAGRQPLTNQIQKRITIPLGMTSFALDVPTKGQKHWAVGYSRSGTKITPSREYANYWKHGAGAYKTNIVDFARWAAALANRKLLKPRTYQQMWTAQKTTKGKIERFGLGVVVSGSGNRLVVSHSGSQTETRTLMVVYPASKSAIVLMSNSSWADLKRVRTVVAGALRK